MTVQFQNEILQMKFAKTYSIFYTVVQDMSRTSNWNNVVIIIVQ